MDARLAEEFRALGGELRENERWTGGFGSGVVRATGRRIDAAPGGWRWFGLKAHLRNAPLEADLEIHLSTNGYVGLCRLDESTVNVCGLFRSRASAPDLNKDWKQWLTGTEGSPLQRRLAGADWVEGSFTAVAGLDPRPRARKQRTNAASATPLR